MLEEDYIAKNAPKEKPEQQPVNNRKYHERSLSSSINDGYKHLDDGSMQIDNSLKALTD